MEKTKIPEAKSVDSSKLTFWFGNFANRDLELKAESELDRDKYFIREEELQHILSGLQLTAIKRRKRWELKLSR